MLESNLARFTSLNFDCEPGVVVCCDQLQNMDFCSSIWDVIRRGINNR